MLYKNVSINKAGEISIDNQQLEYPNSRVRTEGKIDYIKKVRKEFLADSIKKNTTYNGKFFYAGNIYNHFGHFLLESLSRLSSYNGESTLVWTGDTSNQKFNSWQKEIIDIIGLGNKKHLFLNGCSHFNEIEIASRSYIIWSKFTSQHINFLSRINMKLEKIKDKKIWISRSNYKSFNNEIIIETILEKHGWIIINPVDFSVVDQASIFNSAKQIGGVEGSAFHTMILSREVCNDITIFSRRDGSILDRNYKGYSNGNYPLISRTLRKKHKFYSPNIDKFNNVDLTELFSKLNLKTDEMDLLIINKMQKIIKNKNKIPTEDLVITETRNLALSVEGKNILLARDLMEICYKWRKGAFIKKKLDSYKKEIALKKK